LEYMNNTYKTSLEYKKEMSRGTREREIEEEREQLKRIQKDLKEQQRLNSVRKTNFIHEAQEVAEYKKRIKEMDEVRKQQEKKEYQKLAQQNYDQEVERERNYKKFFKDFDSDMTERMANHMKYVTQAAIEKQSKLDEIEGRKLL
jgi:hypothetical protein